MILKKTIDSLLATADIVDVISKFTELKKAGANYKGLSVFNSERTPSLMVSPQKQIFKDFSSGKGGNVIAFIMEHKHCTYPEAIRELCAMYNIPIEETEKNDEEKSQELLKESMRIITEEATKFFSSNLQISEVYQHIVNRGFKPEIIEKFRIGFATGTMTGLVNYLITQRGFNWQLCVQNSIIGFKDNAIYDRFRNRIMFPIRNASGYISGFGGRAIDWKKGDKYPKYLNSSDSIIYNKSKVLYGIYESKKAIAENDLCYLCEGYTDVIGFHNIGIENIVAASGTSFTSEQAKIINRFTKNITVLFDADSPGIKAALRSIDIALAEGLIVKVCLLPAGHDPDSFAKGKQAAEVLEYINKNSQDFIIFKLNYLLKNINDFTNKGAVITEIVNSIGKVRNTIQREVYLKECSRITDVDVQPLKMMMNQSITEDKEFINTVDEVFEYDNNEFLKRQCEARIIQYLLCYKNDLMNFRTIEIMYDDFGAREEVIIEKLTVCQKIIQEVINENFEFLDMQYSQILNIAINSDISDYNNWVNIFGHELFLVADQLRNDEIGMNLTSFAKEGQKTYDYVMKSRNENIQSGLNESLMFFKMLCVENIIAEKLREPEPNIQDIFELIDFNNNIKVSLNLI